jgi:CBS domain-containing protein
MRSPLTGVIFSFELTGDYNAILPLLIACMTAHAFTVLVLKRSILTEKIARRGYHLSREYVVDPMEAMAAKDVMRTGVTAIPADATLGQLGHLLNHNPNGRGQRLYPVVNGDRALQGVVTRKDLRALAQASGLQISSLQNANQGNDGNMRLSELLSRKPVVAYSNEPLRSVVNRMAATGFTSMPVVEAGRESTLVGMIGLQDLLKARELTLEVEHKKERVFRLRLPLSLRRKPPR